MTVIELEEGDRQAIVLALAKLSLSRPGWHPACLSRIAEQLGGRAMYEVFRTHGPDRLAAGWIQWTTENEPEPSVHVLVWTSLGVVSEAYLNWEQGGAPEHWRLANGGRLELSDVTHWMPLPEAPGKHDL